MPQAKEGDTVRVHYTVRLDDGTVFDSSEGDEPLEFTIGEGEVIRGFEEAVVGMAPGDNKVARIPAERGYGRRHEEMVVTVGRDRFPDDLEPRVGQQLQIHQADDRSFVVTVTEVTEATVTLDANHPLAGRDLTFDIQLVEIV